MCRLCYLEQVSQMRTVDTAPQCKYSSRKPPFFNFVPTPLPGLFSSACNSSEEVWGPSRDWSETFREHEPGWLCVSIIDNVLQLSCYMSGQISKPVKAQSDLCLLWDSNPVTCCGFLKSFCYYFPSGVSRGGSRRARPPLHLFVDQTEARRAEKSFLRPPPLPLPPPPII